MSIKLLATDLDGTLLKNNKCIDPETIDYIIKFQENGGSLVLITGRRISEIWDYVHSLKMLDFKSGYIVSCDGQYIWDISSDKKIKNEFLSIQDISYLLKAVKINKFNVSFYNENNDFLLLNKQKILSKLILFSYHKFVKKNSRLKFITQYKAIELSQTGNIEKISFRNSDSAFDICSYFEALLNEIHEYSIVLVEERKIEISKKSVNKCEALKQIVQWNYLCNDDILVFGDEGNDIYMLRYFNHSFAMGNACEYVKQAAKFVTDTNENQGVLKVLKNYIDESKYIHQTIEKSAI